MGQNIAVVGAGICGLCTGLSLARHGNQVTLYERDIPPPEGGVNEAFFEWKRRGAAQFRHPHAFLGVMCNILETNYPDLVEDFWAAGARKVPFEEMLPAELSSDYQALPSDEKMWILMCRRATMETVLRRYVERQGNITIVNNTTIRGLTFDDSSSTPTITGLNISTRDEPDQEIKADLVVDASGRGSKFADWICELGAEIDIEKEDAEIVYYTRHYKLRAGEVEPVRDDKLRSAGDLGYLKFGVFPGEDGHFAIIICLPNGEQELREAVKDPDSFNRICGAIPGLARWIDCAEPTTASFGFADIHAIWKHYVKDDKPAALNFFAVGDAAVRTNPLYGRGCSTGIIHAHILGDLLAETSDPLARATAFAAATEEALRPIYKASLNEDKRGIKKAAAIREGKITEDADSLKKWFALAFGDAMQAASREQIHVLRGIMRTFHLFEKPGEFLKDWKIRLTILKYLLRGRKRNASDALELGPQRTMMIELVDQH